MLDRRRPDWTRRQALGGMAAAWGAAGAGVPALAAAEPPPEVTTIRLLFDPDVPILCQAPQYLAREFLLLEGFETVEFTGWGAAVNETEALSGDTADMASALASDIVIAVDRGDPVVCLGGLHAGCVEMFAAERVRDLADLAGRRVAVNAIGGPEHVFVAAVASYVGLDAGTDIEWVVEPDYGRWPALLAEGAVDVVNAFPPQNLELREMGIGHVILDTTLDNPWRHLFCCMVSARRDFVERHPVATKRAMRAFAKANQLCDLDKQGSAERLLQIGATDRLDYALTTLAEVPYGAWREFDPMDTLRFFALRLHEARFIRSTPDSILARGTDFRFIDELRREMKL